jgi:hypothetical protein
LTDVLRVHEFSYIQRLSNICKGIQEYREPSDFGPGEKMDVSSMMAMLDQDTVISRGSFDAALAAAGAVCEGVDRVISGQNKVAFCAVRPPGHHAGPRGKVTSEIDKDGSHGFCLLNNAAIGAAYAMNVHRKVIVVVVVAIFVNNVVSSPLSSSAPLSSAPPPPPLSLSSSSSPLSSPLPLSSSSSLSSSSWCVFLNFKFFSISYLATTGWAKWPLSTSMSTTATEQRPLSATCSLGWRYSTPTTASNPSSITSRGTEIFLLTEHFVLEYPYWLVILYWNFPTD